MADENIVIGVDLKDDFTGPARRVVKNIDDMGDSAWSADKRFRLLDESVDDVGSESLATAGKARQAARRIKDMGNEALKTAGKLKVLSAVMSRLDRINARAGAGDAAPGDKGKGGDPTGKIVKAGFQFRGLRLAGILAAIASIIPAAVAGISSLAAAAAGLVGALGPLTGLIVAYPGYLAAFGQAFAAIKIGLSGLGEAIKTSIDPGATAIEMRAAKTEFSGLSREFSGQFIKNIAIAKRELDGMKSAIQQGLLPGINNLVNASRSLFPLIATGLASTGSAIGQAINQFATAIGSGEFNKQLTQIMGTNVQVISAFGDAALSGFRGLMNILTAAGPLLIRISQDVAKLFESFSIRTLDSGGLTSFFERTYEVARQVVQIFWDVGMALKNIATIGQPLGQAILDSFSAIADGFRTFTESGDGINQIRQWFIDMTPVIYELGFLIRDVAFALFGLSNPDQFMQISIALRQELLPVLVNLIEHFSLLVPALLQIATAALQMLDAFHQVVPFETVISNIANVLSLVASAITSIVSGPAGGFIKFFMFFLVAAGAAKILGAAVLFLARVALGSALFGAIRGVTVALGTLTMAIVRTGTTSTATATAMRALSVSVRALGVAIRGALIATGVGALIVGIGFVIEMIMNMNGAVEEQIDNNKQWAESLFEVNGALAENSAYTIAKRLADEGVLEMIDKIGISQYDLISALMAGGDAWNQMQLRIRAATDAFQQNNPVVQQSTDDNVAYTGSLGGTLDMGDNLLGILSPMAIGIKQAGDAARAAAPFHRDNAVAFDEVSRAAQAATSSLQKLNGWLDTLGSNASWRQSIMDLRDALNEGTSFKKWTEEGEKNLSSLRGAVEESIEKVNDLYEAGNVKGAERVLQKRIGMLKDIMLELPKEDRKPFQQMIDRLTEQRRRFDRQVQAMMGNPVQAEVPVEMKIKADIRTPSTRDIPQSVLQGLPDISTTTTVERKINVDSSQVDAAKTKTDTLNTTLDTVSGKTFNVTVSYNSLSMAVVKAQTLKTELIALTSKPWIVNVEYRESGKRAEGGPVTSGRIYTVGERGPEAFIGKSGNISMIGVHGQQQKTFGEDGWVVPNHQLAAATAEMASDRPRSNRYEIGDTAPVINIGTINASNEIDVIKAVKKGIAEAERNRRERS